MILVISYDAAEIAFNNPIIETAWCSFCVLKQKFAYGVLYRTNSSNVEYFNSMCEMITNVCNLHPHNAIIISGDWNISNIPWEITYPLLNEKLAHVFCKYILDYTLTQCVNFPTRKNNLLDLMFCKNLTSLPLLNMPLLLLTVIMNFIK